MLVTKMFSDDEWEESHRNRQWLPLKKASSLMMHKPLQDMFAKLASLLTDKLD